MNEKLRGKKRICVSCSAKFFDLNKSLVICPRCGKEQMKEEVWPYDSHENKEKEDKEISQEENLEASINFNDIEETATDEIILEDEDILNGK